MMEEPSRQSLTLFLSKVLSFTYFFVSMIVQIIEIISIDFCINLIHFVIFHFFILLRRMPNIHNYMFNSEQNIKLNANCIYMNIYTLKPLYRRELSPHAPRLLLNMVYDVSNIMHIHVQIN